MEQDLLQRIVKYVNQERTKETIVAKQVGEHLGLFWKGKSINECWELEDVFHNTMEEIVYKFNVDLEMIHYRIDSKNMFLLFNVYTY